MIWFSNYEIDRDGPIGEMNHKIFTTTSSVSRGFVIASRRFLSPPVTILGVALEIL